MVQEVNKNKKSGQAALIIVIVTMVTVLGVGIASSTQSTINLRNTVYSSQSEQALACAEAGGEYAIGLLTSKDPDGTGNYNVSEPSHTGVGYLPCQGDCIQPTAPASYDCKFEYNITNYPTSNGIVSISRLNENSVQELNFNKPNASRNLNIDSLEILEGDEVKAALAVYYYIDETDGTSVERKFYQIGSGDVPDDFESKPSTLTVPAKTVAIRIRPLYADISISLSNYPTDAKVGYNLTSVGDAGPVRRSIVATKFLSQLPAAFDEAVVMLDEN